MGNTLRCAAFLLPMLGTLSPGSKPRVLASLMANKVSALGPSIHSAGLHGSAGSSAAAGESCGAGKDTVVQALELLKADSSRNDLADADEHLKRAIDLCAESGEAWYYRSLVEDKLGHKPQADFALRKAHMFPSEALSEGINPFVLAAPKGAEPVGPIRERWALVIGIGAFADPSIPSLRFTVDDATLVHDVLVDSRHGAGFKPENVRLLTNEKATLREVKESLNWLARNAQPNDLALVYVASHGTAREVDNAMANYITMRDTDFGIKSGVKSNDVTPSDTLYATAFPMAEFANDVATRFKALRTAIFIDTCNSGGTIADKSKLLAPGVANASVSKTALDQMRQGVGRLIFTASQTDQESFESDDFRHGYFTYYLVQALRDHADVPLSQIFALVQKRVSAGVDADPNLALRGGIHQTPVMSRSDDNADFALGSPPDTVGAISQLTAKQGTRPAASPADSSRTHP